MIEEGMARVEKLTCDPFTARCFAFSDRLEEARKSCTPKGRAEGGRTSYDVWLDLHNLLQDPCSLSMQRPDRTLRRMSGGWSCGGSSSSFSLPQS